MRVLIIGVGGVGAMAAWHLAKAGHEVIALERFHLDHDQGSSYGESRIVRRVYPDTLYTALMGEAYRLWDELMTEADDCSLFIQAGGVFCGSADHPHVLAAQEALAASAVPYEVLNAQQCAARFPAFVLQENEHAVYEPSMGYAHASLCLRTAARLARQHGADIREGNPVISLQAETGGSGVRVTLADGTELTADRLLLTAGPWVGPHLAEFGITVPLVVTRQPYLHLEPASHSEDFEPGRFPVWIDAEANAYGFPHLNYVAGVKIGIHDRGTITTPETVDRTVQEEDREAVRRYAKHRFPQLSTTVTYEKVCLYTNTPEEDFIVDAIPGLPGGYVISGCSGHGFKFTPLLGQIAAHLATDMPLSYDLSRFQLSRFSSAHA